MTIWELLVLAVGLAMDAFAVAICKGLTLKKITIGRMCLVGLWFGGFQALMPLIGYLFGTGFQSFIKEIDHWIAFALLVILGCNMIRESGEEEEVDGAFSIRSMFPLAVATSIDALAVGVTFAFLNVQIVEAILMIGIITFLISGAGVAIGEKFGSRFRRRAMILGGLILIFLGARILYGHLADEGKIPDIRELQMQASSTVEEDLPADPYEALEGEGTLLDDVRAAGTLRIGVSPDFAPCSFYQKEGEGELKVTGADITLGQHLADSFGVSAQIVPMEFRDLIEAVAAREVDLAIGGFAYTEDRTDGVLLSSFYGVGDDGGQRILAAIGDARSYSLPENFAGKRVGAQENSLQENIVRAQLPDAELHTVTSLKEAVHQLLAGNVDAIAVDASFGELICRRYPEELAPAPFQFEYQSQGNVIAMPAGETRFAGAVNLVLQEVNGEGLYEIWLAEALEAYLQDR